MLASSDRHKNLAFPLWKTREMHAFKHPKRGAIIMKLLLYFPVNESGALIGGYLQYTNETFLDKSNNIIFVINAGNIPINFDKSYIPYAS